MFRNKRFRILAAGFAAAVALATASPGAAFANTKAAPGAAAGSNKLLPLAAGAPEVSSDPVAYAQALVSPDWLKTPDGLMHKSCVHKLPAGATVSDGAFTLASGARQAIAPCAYARLVPTAPAPTAPTATTAPGSSRPPTTHGWLIASWWNSPTYLRKLTVRYAVPPLPAASGALDYLFSSFEPSDGSTIVQPVLAYGNSPAGGGNYWTITSWYVWGNNSVYGSNVAVSPGDTIYGTMQGNNCNSNGTWCNWQISTVDNSSEWSSQLNINSASAFTTAQGGVLESYGAYHCNMLPAGDHAVFRSIAIYGPSLNQVTPSFHTFQPDPECSMYAGYTSTSTDFYWVG